MAFRPRSRISVLGASAVAVSGAADTSENTLATITVPAGSMGLNGEIEVDIRVTYNSNANNKTFRCRWGGGAGTVVWGPTRTTQLGSTTRIKITNRGAANSQVHSSINNNDASTADGNAGGTASVNTAVETTIVITAQKANAGDTATLESYSAKLTIP